MEKFARRLSSLVTVFLALALFLAYTGHLRIVDARLTGTNPTGSSADTFCVGPKTLELCATSAGNWIPTTNNTQSLGTSALQFSDIETAAINSGGGAFSLGTAATTMTQPGSVTEGTAGTMNAAGLSGTAATQSNVKGVQVFGESDVFFIGASTTIPVNSSYVLVMSSAATVTLTSQPEISTTTVILGSTLLPSGSFLILSSTSTTTNVVLSSSGTVAGSGLVLGAATRTITRHKVLTLILDTNQSPALWREISYSNN